MTAAPLSHFTPDELFFLSHLEDAVILANYRSDPDHVRAGQECSSLVAVWKNSTSALRSAPEYEKQSVAKLRKFARSMVHIPEFPA